MLHCAQKSWGKVDSKLPYSLRSVLGLRPSMAATDDSSTVHTYALLRQHEIALAARAIREDPSDDALLVAKSNPTRYDNSTPSSQTRPPLVHECPRSCCQCDVMRNETYMAHLSQKLWTSATPCLGTDTVHHVSDWQGHERQPAIPLTLPPECKFTCGTNNQYGEIHVSGHNDNDHH
jgi:hypothetical protein